MSLKAYHVLKSHHLARFGVHWSSACEDITIVICHVGSRGQLYGKYSGYNQAKYTVYKHCDSGVIMVLICHVISQDPVNQEPRDFLGRSTSR